jgi:phage head maturation protease
MPRKTDFIKASLDLPKDSKFAFPSAPVEIIHAAAAAAGEEPRRPRFKATAYSGGLLGLGGWSYGMVVDLSGVSLRKQGVKALLDHDPSKRVGHGVGEVTEKAILVEGEVSCSTAAAQEVVENAKSGFPWEVSIGAQVLEREFVDAGASVEVNGKRFAGPLIVARKSVLVEVSFVAFGADAGNKVKIAATAAQTEGGRIMTFEQWLKAAGKSIEGLGEAEVAALKAEFKLAHPDAPAAPAAPAPIQASAPVDLAAKATADIRAAAAAETTRIGEIRALFAGKHPAIEAKAISEGWTKDKAELEKFRAQLPTAPAFHDGSTPMSVGVIEAALRPGANEKHVSVEKKYDAKTLEAASKIRSIGFKELVSLCCAMEGVRAPHVGASPLDWARAGFSTVSLPGILSNTAEKILQDAFAAAPSTAKRIAKKLSANNFKEVTGYRLSPSLKFEKVGASGELKHGTLGEESFTYAVDTYGKLLGLTRVDIINDDLGAFTQLPQALGWGAAEALEDVFWTLFMAGIGVTLQAANGNYISGASTVLSIDGLGLAVKAWGEKVKSNDEPLRLPPASLVIVPTALGGTAKELYKSTYVEGSTSRKPSSNIYAGEFEPIVVPEIGNANFHANATSTGWGVLTDPAKTPIAPLGLAYLNGNENPTVEEVPLEGAYLGRLFRGYLDFGACWADYQAIVWSKGAA